MFDKVYFWPEIVAPPLASRLLVSLHNARTLLATPCAAMLCLQNGILCCFNSCRCTSLPSICGIYS